MLSCPPLNKTGMAHLRVQLAGGVKGLAEKYRAVFARDALNVDQGHRQKAIHAKIQTRSTG